MSKHYIVGHNESVAIYSNVVNGLTIEGLNAIKDAKLTNDGTCIPFSITDVRRWLIPNEGHSGKLLSISDGVASIRCSDGIYMVKISKLKGGIPEFTISYSGKRANPKLEFYFNELTWEPRLDIIAPDSLYGSCHISLLAEVVNSSPVDISGDFTFVLKQEQRNYQEQRGYSMAMASPSPSNEYIAKEPNRPTFYKVDKLTVKDRIVYPLKSMTTPCHTVEVIEFKYKSMEDATTTSYMIRSPFFIPNITANVSDIDRYQRNITSVATGETILIPIRASEKHMYVVKYQSVVVSVDENENKILEHSVWVETNAPNAIFKIYNRNGSIFNVSPAPSTEFESSEVVMDMHIRNNLLFMVGPQVREIKFYTRE